jgi:NAD(P)-dependent dehydrogenase (short-subunit alcohol dehydrogenase family)
MSFCNLETKTILITGGAGMLGSQYAYSLCSYGAKVVIADINKEKACEVASEINSKLKNQNAIPEYIDVLNEKNIQDIFKKHSSINVLINNAAQDFKVEENQVIKSSRFETMPFKIWKESMNVGLHGSFLCSQCFVNHIIDNQEEGNIINVSSDLSVISPDQRIYRKENLEEKDQPVKSVSYSVSKWAIIGLTKYMSTYFASKNIRVNSLSPAGVYSDTLPDEFVTKLVDKIPMGRMANKDEYNGTVLFLCSDASKYMTGHNLVIDGGRSVW